jgi:hypothetical protein
VKRIANWAIEREERRLGVSLDYLREIANGSSEAMLKIALLAPFASHRKRLPKTAYHLAKIVVSRFVDCGSCVQIAVNLALQDGVPRNYVRAVLQDASVQVRELPFALREVTDYARSVAEGSDNLELRETLRDRYGTEGLTELAFAIASAQMNPTIKRALGHAQSCSLQPVTV